MLPGRHGLLKPLWTRQGQRALHTSSQVRLDHQSRSYQYLQESVVPSDKFQASLPRLPIPKLDVTLQRYVASQRPLFYTGSEEFANTLCLAGDFESGVGKELDQELRQLNKANKHTSYINGPWTDMYLTDRRSVAFNHNPGIMFANDKRPEFQDRGKRVANMLISSLRFHKSFREGVLNPEVYHLAPKKTNNPSYWNKMKYMPGLVAAPLSYLFKVFPLDMSQYNNLFQSTRIPLPNRDEVRRFPDSKHVMVMRKGHFYTFPVYDDDWNLFEPKYYADSISYILGDNPPASSEIGVLTSQDRDPWTELRAHLVENLGNAEAMNAIDSALFNIVLDDDWTHDDLNMEHSVKNLVLGHDPTNRWFDKSFSLLFSTNGVVGLNFEHAWGDGVAVMRYVDEVINDSQANDFLAQTGGSTGVNVTRQEIKVDDKVKAGIEEAKRYFAQRDKGVNFKGLLFEGFGKENCKAAKIGPDSIMQASFQIAYHRLHGNFVPTYESCSTAIYKHGRTETMRPGTLETKALTKAFNSGKSSKEELLDLFKKASTKHNELTKQAAQGQGWDRHLFALRVLAARKGGAMPEFFTDEAYKNINQNVISTSTLASDNMTTGGFCPVVPNGFGLGYQIKKNQCGAFVSSYVEHADADQMLDALQDTFKDIRNLLVSK